MSLDSLFSEDKERDPWTDPSDIRYSQWARRTSLLSCHNSDFRPRE